MIDVTDVSPDTLSTARRLEQNFGMDRQASEGVAIAIYEHTIGSLATKADLRQVVEKLRGELKLRGEMKEFGATLRGEMQEFGATLRGEMQELGASLHGEIEASRSHTDAKFAQLRAEMHGEFKNLYRHLWLLLLGFAGLIVTLNKLLA